MPSPVQVVFLGGLGEIGRNCAAIVQDNQAVLIDCGVMFPEADMPGVDLVLPDFTWLLESGVQIEGMVVTHGHEDHVGAISYLLEQVSFPIYGSALTLGMAKGRIEEAGVLDRTQLVPVTDGERRMIGRFDVEFIPVSHSVPHAFATAYRTDQGVILHSGDFKLDLNPVDGRRTDLTRMGSIADNEGIRLLLSDSTNAESKGHTLTESSVGKTLHRLIHAHDGRIIVGCFASHIHRVQQIADAAVTAGRTIATLGRSMQRNVQIARDLGLLSIPDRHLVDITEIDQLPDSDVLVLSTGSQGEPMAGLARMASGENRFLTVGEGDLVILSSHAIPGNEVSVSKVINGLFRRGAKVVHAGSEHVHVSGHASAEELKTLLCVTEPECFVPVHGEYRHLVAHRELGLQMGVAPEQSILALDGDVIELTDDGIAKIDEVPAGYLYVDGIVGDVGRGVLRDRRVLAAEGVVVVIVTLDAKSGELLNEPEIVTRGWVYAPEAETLLDEAAAQVRIAVQQGHESGRSPEVEDVRRQARQALGRFVASRTRRRPMIVPVVVEA